MNSSESRRFTVAEPVDLELMDASTAPPETAMSPCVAMIVCHGMGQQVPFETLDSVAKSISDEHLAKKGSRSVDVVLRFVRPRGAEKLVPRAEVTLKEEGKPDKNVHLYEAYWAPVTEGVIGYSATVARLLAAGFNGLYEGTRKDFKRWMFGEEKKLPIDTGTFRTLLALLIILTPILLLPFAGLSLNSAVKGQGIISGYAVTVMILLILTYFIRRFVVQYMGDVIVYVSSNEVNGYWKVRDEIKKIGLDLAKVVYGAVSPGPTGRSSYIYSDVVVVGHSLGSVVAYDTLNAILNQDSLDKQKRKAAERTVAFITLGSPLDKVAFLFRQKAKDAFARDVLSAAYQPMILDYRNRPRWWINVFCRNDIISGSLEYYDDPESANSEPRRVRNYVDPYNEPNPATAHTGYWDRDVARSFLYLAATGDLGASENESFQHSRHKVKIRLSK